MAIRRILSNQYTGVQKTSNVLAIPFQASADNYTRSILTPSADGTVTDGCAPQKPIPEIQTWALRSNSMGLAF
jgi:hypothetical protein